MDYKIISKAITSRLSGVLQHIVHPDQTCSVPGRCIFSNLFQVRDVLDYIGRTDESAILLNLDQEKLSIGLIVPFFYRSLLLLALVLFFVDGFRPFMKALLCR